MNSIKRFCLIEKRLLIKLGWKNFILFILMVITMYSLVLVTSVYHQSVKYMKTYSNISGVEHSLCVAPFEDLSEDFKDLKEMETTNAVYAIYSLNTSCKDIKGNQYPFSLISKELISDRSNFKLKKEITEGSGFYNNLPVVFLKGFDFQKHQPGEIFEIYIKNELIQVYIGGILKQDGIMATFDTIGTGLSLYDIMSGNEKSSIFMLDTKETRSYITANNWGLKGSGACILSCNESGYYINLENIKKQLSESGYLFTDYQTIINRTKAQVEDIWYQYMMLPIYLFSFSFLFIVSCIIIFIHKVSDDISIFYLCGLSKKRSYVFIALTNCIMTFFAAILNLSIAINAIASNTQLPLYMDIKLNDIDLLPIPILLIIVFLIGYLVAFFMFHKKSFVQIRKKLMAN